MPTQKITWHTHMDDRACKICKALNGFTWTFEAGKDIMTDALWHPVYGIVWSLSMGSNAHARGYLTGNHYNCRCTLEEYQLDLEDVLAKCVFLKETLEVTNNEIGLSRGNFRTTRPEDIGIDLSKYGME